MISLVVYVVAFGAVGWARWVRRGTWRIVWESPTTVASLMPGIAALLIAPDTEPVIGPGTVPE